MVSSQNDKDLYFVILWKETAWYSYNRLMVRGWVKIEDFIFKTKKDLKSGLIISRWASVCAYIIS